ncbi:MAG: hypothetical protein PHD51_02405 [Patescibacteria group bacterium]|nr:hypothetical protein [Patescibacteria group bacterium]MDD5490287.1 hypothetical protein [Patescibacteria group bacterium]
MFETSKDLLYVILAFCILWFTIFICWAIYYFAMILKQFNKTLHSVSNVVEKFSGLVDFAKEKLDLTSNVLALIFTGIKEGIGYLQEKKSAKSRGKKK